MRGSSAAERQRLLALGQHSTSGQRIARMQYMKALLLAKTKEIRDDGSIVEVVVWELPEP